MRAFPLCTALLMFVVLAVLFLCNAIPVRCAPANPDQKSPGHPQPPGATEQEESPWYKEMSGHEAPKPAATNFGYIDKSGAFIIRPQYRGASNFSDGVALAVKGTQWKFIDKSGAVLLEHDTGGIVSIMPPPFSEGLTTLDQNGLAGYVDKKGDFVIPPQFQAASKFSEGVAAVCKKFVWGAPQQWCFIDKTGKQCFKEEFQACREFSEGMAAIFKDGKWGYIDHSGSIVVAPKYLEASPFSDQLAAVATESGWSYINKQGETVIAGPFSFAGQFSEGIASVSRAKVSEAIDKAGTLIKIDGGTVCGACRNGLIPFTDKAEKVGFADKSGKVVIPAFCDESSGFSEGLAAVLTGGKWGYADTSGAMAIKAQFQSAQPFADGLAAVSCGSAD